MEQAWRRSAALILALGRTGNENAPRLVMVQRSAGSSFMPGSHVFPGGLCSEADFSTDWLPVFGSRAKQFLNLPSADGRSSSVLPPPATLPLPFEGQNPDSAASAGQHSDSLSVPRLPPGVGMRLTAIRETFEETGLLLARNADDADETTWHSRLSEAGRFRARVQADARQFVRVCCDQHLCPDLATLHQWSRWLTPAGHKSGRRYDTTFYVATPSAAVSVAAILQPDASEVTSIKIDGAASILRDHVEKRLQVAPPQLYDLARLCTFGSVQELELASGRRELLGLELWAPVMVTALDGVLFVLPGDHLYPAAGKDSEPLSLDLTVDQIMKQYTDHNRVFARRGQRLELSVNVPLSLGQRAPPSTFRHCLQDGGDSKL